VRLLSAADFAPLHVDTPKPLCRGLRRDVRGEAEPGQGLQSIRLEDLQVTRATEESRRAQQIERSKKPQQRKYQGGRVPQPGPGTDLPV
jgi:hypothetical protein